jgi:hypothetical protein
MKERRRAECHIHHVSLLSQPAIPFQFRVTGAANVVWAYYDLIKRWKNRGGAAGQEARWGQGSARDAQKGEW